MTLRDPEKWSRDANTFKAQYLENSCMLFNDYRYLQY